MDEQKELKILFKGNKEQMGVFLEFIKLKFDKKTKLKDVAHSIQCNNGYLTLVRL